MTEPANVEDIIQHTNSQCACIMRTNVLGVNKGYSILCFDGPVATYPDKRALFGLEYDQYWSVVSPNITGTIGITTGTTQIDGTNTVFTSQLAPGDKLIVADKQMCVDTVVDNTTITLTEAYTGKNLSGANMWKL